MSIDPLAPYEYAANGFQRAPHLTPISPVPHNPATMPPGFGAAPPPPPGYVPPQAPMSFLPGAPGPAVADVDYADYGPLPDVNDVKLRDYSEADSRLSIFGGNPNLDYRWCNSDPDRMMLRERQGWRVVQGKDRAASDDKNSVTPMLNAGTQRDGAGRRAVLMCRPKQYGLAQQELHRKAIKQQQRSLDPKNAEGANPADRGSFQGQIEMRGGRGQDALDGMGVPTV